MSNQEAALAKLKKIKFIVLIRNRTSSFANIGFYITVAGIKLAIARIYKWTQIRQVEVFMEIMSKKIIYVFLVFIVSAFVFSKDTSAQTSEKMMSTDTATIVSPEDAVKRGLNVGAKMPSFSLRDSAGKTVSSADLLKEGNLVLVFYRGSWCPFCNTYLHNLQKRLGDITAAGGKLAAISVENPDASMAIAKKNEVQFTVLSDPNLDVARTFGIVYQLAPATEEKYKSFGLDLAKHNDMKKPELPLAVTYIINKNGEIVYAFLETDYKKRAEPDVIIENLKKINGQKK